MTKKCIMLTDGPYGIVPNGITPLYQVGRLQLVREGYGQALIYKMNDQQAWMFWIECSQMLKAGNLSYLENLYLSNTMDRLMWMKDFVAKKIEHNKNLIEQFGEENLILPD